MVDVHCTISIDRLATKVTIAGGALYVAYDSGLLGSSEQGSEALEKAKVAVPPAIEEWMKYFGLENTSRIPLSNSCFVDVREVLMDVQHLECADIKL
ncbi:hypothetical protein INR49_030280 [Caranx melampygus]|nr:hypothetical protein INR49_030280 [Caranx melampygus]